MCMVAESWRFPMKYLKTNTLNKIIFLDSFKKLKFIKKYIYVSTPEVFGSSLKGQKEDENKFNPSTPYAISKLCTELLFKSYAKNFNFPVIIARFSNFYGPGQPVYRLIPKVIMSINKKIKFPLEGGGKSKRNFLFTEDFCRAILCLIKMGKPGQTYHFSGNKFFSISRVVQLICNLKKVNFKKLVKISKDRIGKDDAYKLNYFQTKKKLNWCTKVGINEGLIKTIIFYDQMFKNLKKEPTIFKLK